MDLIYDQMDIDTEESMASSLEEEGVGAQQGVDNQDNMIPPADGKVVVGPMDIDKATSNLMKKITLWSGQIELKITSMRIARM